MKIHKEKTIKKIILVLLIMILGSTLIELGTNIKSLYMKNQNIMKIDEDHIELKGFVKKGKGYYLSNAEGVLRCDLNNKYVKKFVYDFDTGDMVDAEIKVGYDNSMGKEEVMIIEDKNPILLSESVVNVNKKVKWIEISLSSVEGGSGIYIKNIRINNQIEINKYRIFCSSVLILGICVCVIFRKKITKEIAKTSILAAVINVVVNILTIKWLGLYAASISTVVAYLSTAIYRFIDSRKYVKISLNYKFLISILIMFAITIVAYYVRNIMICALIAVVVVIYTIFINRKNVKFVMNMVRKFIKK